MLQQHERPRTKTPNLFGAHRYTILRTVLCALRGPLHGALADRDPPSGDVTLPHTAQKTCLPLCMLVPDSNRKHGCNQTQACRRNPIGCVGLPRHGEAVMSCQ